MRTRSVAVAAVALLGALGHAAEKNLDPAELARQLSTGDVAARREASLQLKRLGPKAKPYLADLIKALGDQDKQVWTNSVGAIAAIGPEAQEAIPALVRDLGSRASRYREQTLLRTSYALTRIGPAAIPPLIEGLRGNDSMLRAGSARALGGMGEAAKEAIPALIENIAHNEANVQREVVDALTAIGPGAKPKLIEVLGWNDARQRSNAALALAGMGKAASDAAQPMMARLKIETDPLVRASLLSALPKVSTDQKPLVAALIEALKDPREDIRHAAINSLLTMRSAQKEIVTALTGLLRDGNAEISDRAAYVLGRLGETAGAAVPTILEIIAKRPSDIMVDALVQIGEPAVGPMLQTFAKTKPEEIPSDHWIIKCLQRMGGVAALPVAKQLVNQSAAVRFVAARTLVELGPDAERADAQLQKALDDPDPRVAATALVGLAAVRAPFDHVEQRLNSAFKSTSPFMRAAAVEATVRYGTEAKEYRQNVIAALKDPDATVRQAALGQLGGDFGDAVGALIPLLDDPAKRADALEALGRMGSNAKAAVPKLAELVSKGSTDERVKILKVIGQIGPAASAAKPKLDAARKDPDPAVRIAAIDAAGTVETTKTPLTALLNAGLDDSEPAVRKATMEKIAHLGAVAGDTAPKLIGFIPDDSQRETAVATLNQINVRDVPMLMGLLKHENRNVRLYAVNRLETLGRRAKEAVPALDEIGKSNDAELAKAAKHAIRLISK